MRPVFELKILQCDGSVKVYNERPWWLDLQVQSVYIHARHVQKKAEKISNTMSQIAAINHETYLDSKLKLGIVSRKNEQGVVTIRDVAGKIAR
jgi:hypothetical protein